MGQIPQSDQGYLFFVMGEKGEKAKDGQKKGFNFLSEKEKA